MFGYLVSQIWKNKPVRYSLLALIVLVIFAFFLQNKFHIYNYIQKLFETQEFDNPLSYKGKPYGFEENASIATDHYRHALLDLSKLAYTTYNYDFDDSIVDKQINLQLDWEKHLSKEALTTVYQLLDDIFLYCLPLRSQTDASQVWNLEERLKKRRLKKQDPLNPSPFDYGIDNNNYHKIIKMLLDIDYSYLYPAIQKKPDSWAIITLHDRLLASCCKTYLAMQWWQKALSYFEYKEEKKLYEYYLKNTGSGNFGQIADALDAKVFSELKNDKRYHDYLREFYLRNRTSTEDLTQKINQAYNNFIITNKLPYLLDYIRLQRKRVLTSSQQDARKIYHDLLNKVQYNNIDANAEYLLALAESALKAQDYNLAMAHINRTLNETTHVEKNILTDAYRLQLIVAMRLR